MKHESCDSEPEEQEVPLPPTVGDVPECELVSIALKGIDFGNDPLTADRLLAVVAELVNAV